ncbi:MAG: SigE family RNA polymerase sigma factor [Acidimicrobiales bacterium]
MAEPIDPTPPVEPAYVDRTFDALYAEEVEAMARLAFLMVGSEEQAEELVHDAFARLYERWDRVDNPGGYLRTCVVNGCKDRLRRRGVERRHPATATGPAEMETDHLADVLAALPYRQRAAVVLRYYEDRSEADIADLLGVRPGTVKSLLHRGLATLRREIEP